MQDFKKAIISTVSVLLIIAVFSTSFFAITMPYSHNYDWHLRRDLAGTLDYLIVGASQGQCALYTEEIDRTAGCSSYNLSYDAMKSYEKKYLLNREFARNNIKTVVLELSYDIFQSADRNSYTDANSFSLMRMDSFSDRMFYYLKYVNLKNKVFVYSEWMCTCLKGIGDALLSKENFSSEQAALKGSNLLPSKDYRLTQDEAAEVYNQDSWDVSSLNEETVKNYKEVIKLCHEHNADVIVAVVPVSDNYLWRVDGLDSFSEWMQNYCAENDASYYDFNLLKNRFSLFSDKDCYSSDTHHMSEHGAKIFSKVFAEITQKAESGNNVDDMFYTSYEEMKQDSPYRKYMN